MKLKYVIMHSVHATDFQRKSVYFTLPEEVAVEQIFASSGSVASSSLAPGIHPCLVTANLVPRPLVMFGTLEESCLPGEKQ